VHAEEHLVQVKQVPAHGKHFPLGAPFNKTTKNPESGSVQVSLFEHFLNPVGHRTHFVPFKK
jgi:hypothetical protein